MNSSKKKLTKDWRCQKPRAFMWYFFVPLVVLVTFFTAYAVGWYFLLNQYFEVPAMRYSFGFGEIITLIGAAVLWTWASSGVHYQEDIFKIVLSLVMEYRTAIELFAQSASPAEPNALIEIKTADGRGKIQITRMEMIVKTMFAILVTLILLLWQLCTEGTDQQGQEILSQLDANVYLPHFYANLSNSASDLYVIVLLDLLIHRIRMLAASPYNMINTIDGALLKSFSDVKKKLNKLSVNYQLQPSSFMRGLRVLYAVLYFLSIPPVLWPTQGEYMIYSNLFVLFVVGGRFYYSFCMSDIFRYPTETYAGVIFDEVEKLFSLCDKKFPNSEVHQPCTKLLKPHFYWLTDVSITQSLKDV